MSNVVLKQFFSGAGSFSFPAGVSTVTFKGCGGGGGGGAGGGSNALGQQGGGGGGGGAAVLDEATIFVASDTIYNYVVGASGAGGLGVSGAAGNPGNPGGDTIVTNSVTGFILIAFKGASGGGGGTTNDGLGGWGGSEKSFGSPTTNLYDTNQTLSTSQTGPGNSPAVRAGGQGGAQGQPGFAGNFDPLQDSSVIAEAGQFAGGTGGAFSPLAGGGGGGGAGSALGPGGNGGIGGAGQGGAGSPAVVGTSTGAGGGGGGGSGTAGAPLAGGNGGPSAGGFLQYSYENAG